MKTIAFAAALSLCAGATSAATTGFSLLINGNNNIPTFSVTNTGDTGTITKIVMTLGDSAYNFDSATITGGEVLTDATLGAPDTDDGGGLRSDFVEYTFGDFDIGEIFSFTADIDLDNNNTVQDFTTDGLPGGSFEVFFADGFAESLRVGLLSAVSENGDALLSDPFSTSATATPPPMSPVPLPAGGLLLLGGLGALGIARRRKTQA